jgi:1,4-alpha-glucan branching enzyme
VPSTDRTTFQPYWVAQPRVAAIGRNVTTGLQVWSAEHGYPGDFLYREFHKKDGESGLHYWRVTGARVGLGDKASYDPNPAFERAGDHARHFASLVEDQVRGYHESSGRYGIVSAAYDTELLGHWWFEGVTWLQEVLRTLARSETVAMTGAAQFVREHPPEDVVALPEGSWGQGGNHFTWQNADTAWMWPLINGAARRMEEIAGRPGPKADLETGPLAQLARELLLLESSDWPFLVTTGQARAYAELRFTQHLERFNELAAQIESGQIDPAFVDSLWERDKLFPDIDCDDFATREGSASARVTTGRP